ncbi:hypothetical protein BU26DRAFT_39054 [Trematosphaeria pertusa]|uniref:Uncharacterized protein n=1 Tax=Trematosphaeria pertusa TaxID=390896 RepID=A0A6A6J486_9PLEO|nr:uncharacterized protein BU26DRAFT_39054 [Trematosphaeria pertusa]KAF2257231.1 hypothetical protein BU26DRAFT_39054 [Trematosphaeria pertusa]
MASQLQEPLVARSGSSVHSREEDEFTTPQEENPLDVASTSSIQHTPSVMQRHDPLDDMTIHHDQPDEPPPPYEPLPDADAPQIAPIEYSCENSPQLLTNPPDDFPEPPPRNRARLSATQPPEFSPVDSPRSPTSLSDPTLVPAPLQLRPTSSSQSIPRRPLASRTSETATTFSSAKAREAGFEIQQPPSPRRTESSSSLPSITVLPSTDALKHTLEPGKATAYLIPFPKPRLKGVKVEDIPERFLVYTPPLPPLLKPAPGEKESHWHKTQRLWQEDVRKATISNASVATWKGIKAKSTSLIHKGVNLTRSTNVEFLDRVSGGAVTSTTEDIPPQDAEDTNPNATAAPEPSTAESPREGPLSPGPPSRTSSSISIGKDAKPKPLEELTLIFPPSLHLTPEQIRTEFVDNLMRARDKSRKDAFVASALLPFAAAVDACVIVTFGGLTQISGVWAYTSTRGAMTSNKLTRKITRGEQQAAEEADTEIRGCTCGYHHQEFGCPEAVPKHKQKGKKKSINLQMQQNSHLEILRRYLDLACLKREFNMFPQIEEAAGDVNEESVLEAIGWRPTRRHGRDLEVEFKDRVEKLTPEQDEQYQQKEARDDVKRYLRKGAAEWVAWCKAFQKDPEAALKK